ncbi:Mu-like prophage major head subunit gpT family protein [Candidatus Dojkabacteria bacterium]|jgi:phage major head subunit gpT-like protein|nr:Mu-like prophage major head subunit gpT family protein [Candidatus Dojkabacteria bacterium]
MPITSAQIVDTLDANLNSMYQDGLEGWGNEYQKVFNVLNSTKQTEQDSYESGFGAMPEKPEGVAATYDTIYPGIKETYTHKTYALGYEITEEAIEDNLQTPETFNKLPQALSRSGEETIELTAANVFNNGFSTNGFDGVPLFSESHPKVGGGTQSNKPSTDADLSITSLTAGLTAIEKFTDERGLKKPTKAVLLLVPVDLWNVAEELLESEYKPYVANNEVNALQKKDLQYFVYHYLTDTDAWFLLAEKSAHMLKFYWRVKPGALRRGTDFDSTNLKHLARMRFSVGYSHHMGTYGTSGA